MKQIAFAIVGLSFLSSCAGYIDRHAQPQMVAEPSSVELMLADAADRATRALETLAAMESTKMPVKPVAIVPNAPTELQRAVTFDWVGPVEPLVEELTRKAAQILARSRHHHQSRHAMSNHILIHNLPQ